MPEGTDILPANAEMTVERIGVTGDTAACDGGVGPLGHPRIYLPLRGGEFMCPYCSRIYYSEDAGHGGH